MNALSTFLLEYFPAIPLAAVNIISFAILFIVTNIVLRFIAGVVTRTLRFALLGWLNRLLGGIAGLIKSIFLLTIVVFLIGFIPFSETYLEKAGLEESFIFPILKSLGPKLYQQILNLSFKV
jgi:membrane protein required for colicin V production